MPRNPLHDAQWQARLDAAERDLAAARRAESAAAISFGGPAHRAALVWLDAALAARRDARRMQFETIADYANWRFSSLAIPKDGFGVARVMADFASLQEVDAAFEHALRDEREGTLEQRFRLETGQPPGMMAFAEAANVVSSWRQFGTLDCMVSFCVAEDLFHICLAHAWGALALQSNEIFRTIATQLTRESLLLQLPDAAPVFQDDGHRLAKHRDLIRQVNELAAKFRFYRHLLPERGLREEFCRVDMLWNGASWIDPEWSSVVYDKLPVTLREAAGQPGLPALPGRNFPRD
ncbi:hypothetical protein [Acidocella sp.]|uniref:hypothetical protein n=1 Tax=Acidocella sp. TaxID=50710 RepID=UPI00260EB59A|nr:hypothetical protein [Acidocella sp.]